MINALIQNGDQTAVLNLPSNPFSLLYDLSQIGIRSRLRDIPINDDEDSGIQVKLFADSDIGSSLAVLFKPSHSLEDANLCAHMVENARPEILEELEQHIIHGQYFSPQAVMEDIKAMTEELISVIAKRPRAERHGAHGLFTDADVPINLSKVAEEVANHEGNVWTHIISLRREDAARLGYDNAYAWRNLLRSQAETIAENMKIPLTDLRWYAAYHDESYHPHVHMVVYSAGKEPYLTKLGIRNIKAAFARQIFRHDLLQVYEDNIVSVEESYRRYSDRITILGGIDLNFLITSDTSAIQKRCRQLLEMSAEKGRYLLGSGNSLAYYLPIEKIIAMIQTVTELDG